MLEEVFQDVYTKFKLHFYQNVFQRFATREATLTTVESFCMEGIMAMGEPTIAEFSRMMRISTPNAAYKIGSLVKKGYVEKIQSTVVNTIPLWKIQMVLALGIAHSTEAAQAQRQVTDLTNELLKKNAQALHLASTETAKESERGIVDIETLKQTNQELISTLDDVMKIQKEGRIKRQQAEVEMRRMEDELKNKLLEIQH